jgi:hypothetical protein
MQRFCGLVLISRACSKGTFSWVVKMDNNQLKMPGMIGSLPTLCSFAFELKF